MHLNNNIIKTINAIDEAIFIVDGNYNIQEVNEYAISLLKRNKDDLLNVKLYRLLQLDNPHVACPLLVSLLSKQSECGELDVLNGIKLKAKVTPVIDENNFTYFLYYIKSLENLMTNINSYGQIHRDGHYKTLFENAPLAYQSLDRNGNLLETNKKWLDTLGYEKEEVIGKWFGNFLREDQVPLFITRFAKFMTVGCTKDTQFIMLNKNGKEIHVSFEGLIGYTETGEVRQTYCVFKDITQEQALVNTIKVKDQQNDMASLSLKQQEALISSIYKTVPSGVGIITNRVFDFVNERFCKMTGYSFDQVVGRSSKFLYINDEEFERVGKQIYGDVHKHGTGRIEAKWRTIKNKVIDVLIQVSYINEDKKTYIFSVLNITDKKKYERKLIESEERHKSIFENSLSPMLIIDPANGHIFDVNKAAESFYGFSKKEMLEMKVSQINTSLESTLLDVMGSAVEYKRNRFEFKHRLANGLEKDVVIYTGPVMFDGKTYLFSIIHDISVQKQQEVELKDLTDKLVKAQEIAKMGSWELDLESGQVVWSDNFFRLLGYEPNSFKPTFSSIINLVHLDEREAFVNIFSTANNLKIQEFENRFIRADGELVYLGCRGEIDLVNGRKIATCTVIDISESKLAALAVEQSNKFVHSVMENLQEGVVVYDEHFNVLLSNKKMEEMSGLSYSEVVGKNAFDLDSHLKDEGLDQLMYKALGGEIVKSHDVNITNENGKSFYYSAIFSPNFSSEGKIIGVIGVVTDVTERKHFEDQLMKNNEDLVKTNTELDNFVYRVSHDLRAPITSSLGLSRLLQDESSLERMRQYAQLQEQSLLKLDKFIKDILDFSRNSRMAITPEKIDFNNLVQDILKSLEKDPDNKNVKIELRIEQRSDFYSDKVRLSIILNNLISNAFKFQNPYEHHQLVQIEVACNIKETVIVVRDNGIGIALEHQDKVFRMFYRATDRKPGSGIGLYIVQDCLVKLNGSVQLESELGVGSNFTIKLPNFNTTNNDVNVDALSYNGKQILVK